MGPGRDTYDSWAAEQFKLAREALEWNWGEAYVIAVTAGEWTAERRDKMRERLRAGSPEELRGLIFEDYSALPVPRGADGHDAEPETDTAYTIGGPRDGRLLDMRFKLTCWPARGVCACGQVVRRQSEDEPWEHVGMPGDSI